MGNINIQQAMSRLEEVANATAGLLTSEGVRSLSGLFVGGKVTTTAEVESGSLLIKQVYSKFNDETDRWDEKVNVRRFSSTGQVYTGRTSTNETRVSAPVDLIKVFVGGMGVSVEGANGLVMGAINVYKCTLQTNGLQNCAAPLEGLKREVKEKLEGLKREAKEKAFDEARSIWDKVDNFLKAADAADSSDSDSDVLKAIVKKHVAARSLVKPETLEGATALREAARRMLAEFEGSSHLKSLVMEEGNCSYVNIRSTSCRGGSRGEHTKTCQIEDFKFSETGFFDDCKEPSGGGKDK